MSKTNKLRIDFEDGHAEEVTGNDAGAMWSALVNAGLLWLLKIIPPAPPAEPQGASEQKPCRSPRHNMGNCQVAGLPPEQWCENCAEPQGGGTRQFCGAIMNPGYSPAINCNRAWPHESEHSHTFEPHPAALPGVEELAQRLFNEYWMQRFHCGPQGLGDDFTNGLEKTHPNERAAWVRVAQASLNLLERGTEKGGV